MKLLKISEIYYTEDALFYPLTKKIFKKFKNSKLIKVKSPKELYFNPLKETGEIEKSKKRLFLTVRKGNFIEKCPGTKNYLCCNYYVYKNIVGCNFDCAYCYLQIYENLKAILIYVNLEDMLKETELFLKKNNMRFIRIGTGEFSDSISLDSLIDINRKLIKLFSKYENAILELKTKSSNIDYLLKLDPKGRTTISYSINPSYIIENYEKGTSSFQERLNTLKKLSLSKFKIGIHFDPVIFYKNWEKDYKDTIKNVFKNINLKKLVWVSIGTFRFYPKLKHVIRKRFPENKILYEEFIRADDGKFRYFYHLRKKLTLTIKKEILKISKNIPVYLCMENKRMWNEVFKNLPYNIKNLNCIFK